MDERKQKRNNLLVRLGGLFCISLVGFLVICCGLALAFGNYRLSTIFFFVVLGVLICIKLVIRFLH